MANQLARVFLLLTLTTLALCQEPVKPESVAAVPAEDAQQAQQQSGPLAGQVADGSSSSPLLNDKTLKVVIGRVHQPGNAGAGKDPASPSGKPHYVIAAQVKRTAPTGNGNSSETAAVDSGALNQFAAAPPEINRFAHIAQPPSSIFNRPKGFPIPGRSAAPTDGGTAPEHDKVCCDVKIIELYEKLNAGGDGQTVPSPPAAAFKRGFFSRQSDNPGECTPTNPYCCDPRIVKMIEELIQLKKPSPPSETPSSPLEGNGKVTRFHVHHVPLNKERNAASSVFQDPSSAPTVIFSSVGLAQGEQKSEDAFQVARFKKTRHNFGEGFDAATSVFRAPVSGLYSFQLRLHSGDTNGKNKTCMAIAAYPALETRTAEACFESDTTGFIIANRVLREGEQVAAVFAGHVVSTSASSGRIAAADPDELRFAEFFGLLVRPVVKSV